MGEPRNATSSLTPPVPPDHFLSTSPLDMTLSSTRRIFPLSLLYTIFSHPPWSCLITVSSPLRYSTLACGISFPTRTPGDATVCPNISVCLLASIRFAIGAATLRAHSHFQANFALLYRNQTLHFSLCTGKIDRFVATYSIFLDLISLFYDRFYF